ncbi:hypothetical protein ETB97_007048 [Aspergillus alliaceus]|uniref:Uncharacterized protein n=1 Tax=Petromyces alliaceus TaxID=209559 RepID=A0A8H5ZWR3_PETAA|nr:hypothetical protein ETB97_007048 [Aspergillus burnettii]
MTPSISKIPALALSLYASHTLAEPWKAIDADFADPGGIKTDGDYAFRRFHNLGRLGRSRRAAGSLSQLVWAPDVIQRVSLHTSLQSVTGVLLLTEYDRTTEHSSCTTPPRRAKTRAHLALALQRRPQSPVPTLPSRTFWPVTSTEARILRKASNF